MTAFDWFYAHETTSSRILAPFLVDADKPLADLAVHHLYVIDATRLSPLDARAVIEAVSGAVNDSQLAIIGASR